MIDDQLYIDEETGVVQTGAEWQHTIRLLPEYLLSVVRDVKLMPVGEDTPVQD